MSDISVRPITEEERQDAVDRITADGFAVLDRVIEPQDADRLRDRCNELHETIGDQVPSASTVTEFHGTGDVRMLYNLHNKDRMFRHLMFAEGVVDIAGRLLRAGSYGDAEPFQIALTQARGLVGPHPAQQLHIDCNLPGTGYPLVLQAAFALNDFDAANGATRVVPGSHRRREFAAAGVSYDDEVLVDAERGSLVLFDGGVWHGSSAKTDEGERWIIVTRYSRWFMRPQFDITRCTPRPLYDELTDQQRELLGFRFNPSGDEFQRVTRMSPEPELPGDYELPFEPSI